MIKTQIILDSLNARTGDRLVTWENTAPRFIHSEFMTHRCFSRNAASSRAIPINKVIERIKECPAFFEQLGINKAGMQAVEIAEEWVADAFKTEWEEEAKRLCEVVWRWSKKYNLHKQILNRILEPFQHMTVIASATEVDGFFHLRAEKMADPTFQVLAYRMLNTYINSEPVERTEHFPYTDGSETNPATCSVARCARVSYCRQNEIKTFEEDVDLFEKLMNSGHWSPFEHVARTTGPISMFDGAPIQKGNFKGWYQLRHDYDKPKPKYQKHQWERHLELRPSWITL
jgi:thymidylate synthase ThyX